MERMWRKVNHSFGGRSSKTATVAQSADTTSSGGGICDGTMGMTAASGNNTGNMPSSTATGRRLAASGLVTVGSGPTTATEVKNIPSQYPKSLSQHVLHGHASSDRRRRRRRKSRSRRTGVSCVGGGGGDNMSSSGGFYTIKDSSDGTIGSHRHHRQLRLSSSRVMATSAPSGTVMMYPNTGREVDSIQTATCTTTTATAAAISATPDISLRQRAVAKLRMFNFHLNWDLHMTHCKPCGPRLGGGGSGNIIMRRLCRNRRHEDNELYRSNSFKFERFERKECIDELTDTMKKQIAICDDYSLPVDFVKKRPSSFDPCLAEAIPINPEHWIHPSPHTEFITLNERKETQFQDLEAPPPPPPSASLSTLPTNKTTLNILPPTHVSNSIQRSNQSEHTDLQTLNTHSIQLKSHNQNNQTQSQPQFLLQPHPPLPTTVKHASIKLIEGYSDPKDSKRHKKQKQKRLKRRVNRHQRSPHQISASKDQKLTKRSNCSSDSSGPKSSGDENNESIKVPELNSPDSISDDLVQALPSQLYRSPRKLVAAPSDTSKRNPSPYYYSDILKSKDNEIGAPDKDTKNKSRQSTVSEPPHLTHSSIDIGFYRKSTSLDIPEDKEHDKDQIEQDKNSAKPLLVSAIGSIETPKRYSFTEEGVHIIRCDSPTTSTSEESDCSECQKRRQWHARALALVRKTCNIQPICAGVNTGTCIHQTEKLQVLPVAEDNSSMPPHKQFGPAICACVAPTVGDDIDEFFRPRSIFYVHPNGVHECPDCVPDVNNLNSSIGNVFEENSETQLNCTITEADDDEMSSRTRQLYETAFDCKIAKSDDDLDEVDRVTNHSVLFQPNSSTDVVIKPEPRPTKSTQVKSRLEGKRLKNSKNHAIQEKSSNSGGNASGNGSPLSSFPTEGDPPKDADYETHILKITAGIEKVLVSDQNDGQQMDLPSTSTSQLPIRGYTPSPPSTAPLPIKFPGKHDRFLMNSIKSAPNLPYTNPAHPRLRDLRLPLQSSLRQQHQLAVSVGTSNENSITDSAYVNPPSSTSRNIHNITQSHSSRGRNRPRSFVIESGRVLELRKSHVSHRHHVGNDGRRPHNYSSTESIATSSSGGSMESLRSSTSEGNRSTSSSESRNSTSLSSHSSESGSSSVALPLRAPIVVHSKLHILSPISDKSSQEPASELSEQNKTQHTSPEEITQIGQQLQTGSHTSTLNVEITKPLQQTSTDILKKKKLPANKTLLNLTDEIIGSDSGISLHSREDSKLSAGIQNFSLSKLNFPQSDKVNESSTSAAATAAHSCGVPKDLRDLPFDMPKLRRKKALQQEACTSGSATSVDLGDLPFDMPKLRRRLRTNQTETGLSCHSTESSGLSQASSSHSMRDENKISLKLDGAIFRQNLTLNFNEPRPTNKFGSLDLRGLSSNKELNLNIAKGFTSAVDLIDISIPLERQGWYHGAITRIEAENTLRPLNEGSFLVRNCESTKQDYSLSLKGAKGFMHMRIQRNESGQYILGQFSRPFEAVPDMIRHFCLNRLPVRGAEHMCLIEPVIVQLL
ncbi:serine-rich adhesin for platelets isoform X1 [Bactrocera oleae]|uniref:serine-rich adhesin for platelets isoform X1 n=1 Tax=Bactrocera oleae TaxID=104688 RepID=UPI0006B81C6E